MSKPYIVVGGKRHPIVHGIKLGKSAKFLDGYVKITAESIDAADKDHTHSQYITNITSKMITDALGYTPSKNVEVINNLESTSTDSALSANQGKALKDLVDAKQPKGDYASASHTHDWDSVTGKPATYPPSSHNHDERYYTETEIDTKLSAKSNTGHTHAWNTITGKPDTFTPSSHKHTSDDIESLDAGKITGKINIENLPAGALERCVHVADDNARFALTTEYVQLGDTVKVESTGLMYYVTDVANLDSEDGYDVYTAGSASTVPWSGVTGKPASFTPSSHTHDDRYYTESEIDTKLGTKANANHTHSQYLTNINSKMITDALGYTPPTVDTNTWRPQPDWNATSGDAVILNKPASFTPSSHTHTKSEVGLGNVDNTADASKNVKSTKKIQTYKQGSTTETYGDEYPIYAQWRDSSHVRMKCDNNTVETDYATTAGSASTVPWSGVTGKPAIPESGDYTADNTEALLKKIMGLTPRMGSTCFTKDTHVGNTWWNFFYIPHRNGVGMDNGDYGTLLLFPMAGDGTSYIVRAGKGGVIASLSSIITSSNISSQSVNSATTVNGHTVESNVPANAKFTDTIYDDTKIQKKISDNGYGEIAGGKNLATVSSFSTANNEIIFTKKDDSTLIANGKGNLGTTLSDIFLAKAGIIYTAQIITDLQLDMFIWNVDEQKGLSSIKKDNKITSFSVTKDTNISIAINTNNAVFNNTEIKVQLEIGSEATSYEPYFQSNKMLAEEKADKSETTVNLLNPTLQTTSQSGVTCTNNGDGTYTFTGTNSSATLINFLIGSVTIINEDWYKLVGCPTNKSTENHIHIYLHNEDYSVVLNDFGNNGKGDKTFLPNGVYSIRIEVIKNETVNDVFKPMLTTNLNATYDDFVPYTGNSGSLNGDVANIKTELDKKANSSHTHTKSEITDFPTIPTVGSGTITINQGGTKKGSFTVNQSGNTTIELTDSNTDTKNTAGSTDTSSKIFLVGATSQAANPQTYSDNQVYATNGQLNGNSVRVAESVTLQYDSMNKSLDFVFS